MVSPSPGTSPAAGNHRSVSWRSRLVHIYTKEIWQPSLLKERSVRGYIYAVLRVVSITLTVISETRVASRAAALSFSSLLGLGPLIAIGVLIGGFMLGNNSNPANIANKLGEIIETVAPQLKQLDALNASTDQHHPGDVVSPEIVTFVNNIIVGAKSGSGGVFGAISLILIVLLLFKSIEDAFNDIWGVRTGRSVIVRVVFYWTILTLGSVFFFAAVALLSAGAYVNVFNTSMAEMPGGTELLRVLRWSLPLFSITLLVGILMVLYRVIPNTRVFWSAALAGAIVVTALLLLNNFVALLYVRRVILTRSLYGSVALPLVLMLGLSIFWLYLLIGGIVSYAVQNVHFRNSQAAWSTLASQTRERLSLAVFLTICRRFRECLPPVAASELSAMLKVPTQLVNECLGRLQQLKLVMAVQPAPTETETEDRFQPARPLNRVTLFDFKNLGDNLGENPLGSSLEHIDPLLAYYDAALARVGETELLQKSLEQLFTEHPFDESRPPFPTNERLR